MIEYLTSREFMAAVRFTTVVVLCVAASGYASQLLRRWSEKSRRLRILGLALVIEMYSAMLHQLYWWANEIAWVKGHCWSAHPTSATCEWATWWQRQDWITLFAYAGWICGASMLLSLWLESFSSKDAPERSRAIEAGVFVAVILLAGMKISEDVSGG